MLDIVLNLFEKCGKSGIYPNSQALGGAKYIYLFSQQGYTLLCKLLRSDLARQIYKQMVREYFRMASIPVLFAEQKVALEIICLLTKVCVFIVYFLIVQEL